MLQLWKAFASFILFSLVLPLFFHWVCVVSSFFGENAYPPPFSFPYFPGRWCQVRCILSPLNGFSSPRRQMGDKFASIFFLVHWSHHLRTSYFGGSLGPFGWKNNFGSFFIPFLVILRSSCAVFLSSIWFYFFRSFRPLPFLFISDGVYVRASGFYSPAGMGLFI